MTQLIVLNLIRTIRESFIGSKKVYTEGSCYQFYKILKCQFSDAIPYIKDDRSHVVTEIGGYLYDINGLVEDREEYEPMDQVQIEMAESWKWDLFATGMECPDCDGIFGRDEIDKHTKEKFRKSLGG